MENLAKPSPPSSLPDLGELHAGLLGIAREFGKERGVEPGLAMHRLGYHLSNIFPEHFNYEVLGFCVNKTEGLHDRLTVACLYQNHAFNFPELPTRETLIKNIKREEALKHKVGIEKVHLHGVHHSMINALKIDHLPREGDLVRRLNAFLSDCVAKRLESEMGQSHASPRPRF